MSEAAEQTALLKKPVGDLRATIRVITTAGAGLVADGYDLQVINLALAILSGLYPDMFGAGAKGFAASMTLAGVVIGMLSFGALADAAGRRTASLTTALLTIVGAGLSACAVSTGQISMLMWFSICRFFLGLGIGGEYPLSAALSKEVQVDQKPLVLTRLQLLCVNMALLNVGSCLQALLIFTLLATPLSMEAIWRIALAGGMVPSSIAFGLRLMLEEPHVETNTGDAYQRSWRHYMENLWSDIGPYRVLLGGCCLSWFFFNMVAYSLGTFGAVVTDDYLGTEGLDLRAIVRQDAIVAFCQGVVQLIGSFVGSFMLNAFSAPHNQLLGFAGLGVNMWILGTAYDIASLFTNIFVWVLAMLFISLIGLTTYCCPAEGFPTSIRASCMGAAAASGKTGAMLGTALFPTAVEKMGLDVVLIVGGFLASLGVISTFLVVNDKEYLSDKLKE